MPESIPIPSDQDQRDVILNDLDTTILVEASAGTGKTTSMVGRMVNLLAKGRTKIDSLAAVTFTRKAAAELRARFQQHLEHSLVTSCDSREKTRLSESIEHFERCFIGTIHSFCGRILRERPIEAGLDIQFIEIEDQEDLELRKSAWHKYVSDLYRHDDPILDELESLGVEVGQLEPSFMAICDYPDVETWPAPKLGVPNFEQELSLLDQYCSHMEQIARDLPDDAGNDTLIPKYLKIPMMLRQTKHRNELHDFIQILEEFVSDVKPLKKIWKSCPARLDDELALWNDFRDNVAAPAIKLWQEFLYEPLLRAITKGICYYDRTRSDSARLNFQDLLLNASRLLRDHPEVRLYFKNSYSHILVDEFQDTDPIQAEVMLYLTSEDYAEKDWRRLKPAPGSLFVVGDPKQSIYRFRRADIITYDRVKQIIQESGGRVVNLSTNFRTISPIIDWINSSFNDEFKQFPEHVSPDYIPLQKGRYSSQEAALQGVRKLVIPKQQSNTENIVNFESDVIASFISHCISNGLSVDWTPKENQAGRTPEASPEDFLIITPTMKNMRIYNDRINRFGIPTEVTGGGSLNSVPQLYQFYVLLKAIIEPYDPVALVAALRGPLFGVSDRDLYDFYRSGGQFNYTTNIPRDIEPSVGIRFSGFFARLRTYSKLLRSKTILPAIEYIMADCGIQLLASIGPNGNIAAGTLSKAIEILRGAESGLFTARDYLKLLEELVYGERKSDAVPVLPKKESAVRIMNLHKAKGLEAPVVFLADPTGKRDLKPSMRIDRSETEIRGYMVISANFQGIANTRILATPKNWDSLAKEENVFQSAEELRLKYVAATRAGSMLVISDRPQNVNRNLWAFFNPKLEDAGEIVSHRPSIPKQSGSITITPEMVSARNKEMLARLEKAIEPTFEVGSVKSLLTGIGKISYAPSSYGTEWGTAIHDMLEALMKNPKTSPQQFRSTTLPQTELMPELWEDAIETVLRVSKSEIWKRALNAEKKFAEIPFTLSRGLEPDFDRKVVIRGIIDLVFKESAGWTIVDYKSDRVQESRLDYLIELYEPQLKGYAEAWTQITGESVAEMGLYFTHPDRYVPLRMQATENK